MWQNNTIYNKWTALHHAAYSVIPLEEEMLCYSDNPDVFVINSYTSHIGFYLLS